MKKADIKKKQAQGYMVTTEGALEHRVVYEKTFGPVSPGWVVHHVNGQKNDNRPENLVALPAVLHDAIHKIQREAQIRFDKDEIEIFLPKLITDYIEYTLENNRLFQQRKLLTDGWLSAMRIRLEQAALTAKLINEQPFPKNRPTFKAKILLRRR